MDKWGFLLIIIGAIIYAVNRKQSKFGREWGIMIFGIGVGIVIGAIGSAVMVQQLLNK
jgi:Na+/H+ antiporter NhaD/arsenite permease-like protein